MMMTRVWLEDSFQGGKVVKEDSFTWNTSQEGRAKLKAWERENLPEVDLKNGVCLTMTHCDSEVVE